MKTLIASIICVYVALFAAPARADKCPVTIEHLVLNSLGAAKGFAQYELIVDAASPGPVEVHFNVAESNGSHGNGVVAPELHFINDPKAYGSGMSAMILFPWQAVDILNVSVAKVVRLDTKETTLCADPPSGPLNAEPLQNAWKFDDRLVVQRPEMVASVLDPSWNVIRKMSAEYPEQPKEHNVQGSALVAASIGTDGHVLAGSILDYKGSSLFGDAALKAAEASTFKPPFAAGLPTAITVIVQYDFTMCSIPPEAGLPPCPKSYYPNLP